MVETEVHATNLNSTQRDKVKANIQQAGPIHTVSKKITPQKRKKKLLLISPPTPQYHATMFPMGLAYISAILKQHNFQVRAIDKHSSSFEDVDKYIKEYKPSFVGITCLTGGRHATMKVVKMVKDYNPKIPIILGGPHATALPEHILRHYPVDIIVLGEAEITTLELTDALVHGKPLSEVKGIIYKEVKNGIVNIYLNPSRPYLDDLDVLPFPDLEHYDFSTYKKIDMFDKKGMCMELISSRGCPYDCKFCSTKEFWTRRYRQRSAKNVVDEIEMLYKKYGVKIFNFADDLFSMNQQRAIEICQEIVKRKLPIVWSAQSRVNCVSDELCQWLKKANCVLMQFGIESGNQGMIDRIGKRITVEQAKEAFRLCHKYGIRPGAYFMVGNLGETDATVQDSIKLIKEINPYRINVSIAVVYPESEYYTMMKEKGLITDDYWLDEHKDIPVLSIEYTVEQMNKWRQQILFAFLKQKGVTYSLKKFLKTPKRDLVQFSVNYVKSKLGVKMSDEDVHV